MLKRQAYTLLLMGVTSVSLIIIGMVLEFNHPAMANSDALWGPQAGLPTVKVVSDNYTPSQEEKYNCHDHDFVMRVSSDYQHPFYPAFSDQTYQTCAFYTTFGLVGTNLDYMQLNNSVQPYHVSYQAGISDIIATPNSQSLFFDEGLLQAYDDPQSNFVIGGGSDTNGVTYPNEYHLKSGSKVRTLEDSNGKGIGDLNRVVPSANAQWFIIQRDTQYLRVKADDFSILAFSGAPYQSGQVPNVSMAISNSGRYVVAAEQRYLSFKLYDLSTCQPDPSYNLNDATSCGELDLTNYMQQQLNLPIVQINYPHFNDDGTELSLDVVVNDNGTNRNELVTLVAPGAEYRDSQPQPTNYIALGDSYASGEGTNNYLSGTDEDANKCHLSLLSYPYLLGLNLQLDSAHSVACSGAKMINVNGPETAAAQYTTIPDDAYDNYWLPGYSPQLNFIEQKQPNIVTISMGGNDIGFSSIIEKCITVGTCFSTYEDRMGLVKNINSKFDNLIAMYTQIKAAAAPGAKVYVISYPQVVAPDGDCGLNVHLDRSETEFASELIDYLDQVIRQAAEAAGVGYVNTQDAFDGHRLCDAGNKAVNGLTAGNDKLDLIGNESYHPDSYGYQLLAGTIKSQTDDFKEAMPAPDWSIESPDMSYAVALLDAPKSNGPISRTEFDDHSPVTPLLRGGVVSGNLNGPEYHFEPGASYAVELHTTPIDLGTVAADSDGNLNYSFTVPTDIEPGWHTIDVTGDDITDQPIDIQRLVYIAVSANDWDGNGVPNNQEPCGLIPASGVDADQDGVDDACDADITKPPVPATPTVTAPRVVNSDNQGNVAISGIGQPGTTAHISIDDTDIDTSAVTATTLLPPSGANAGDFYKGIDVSSLDDGPLTVSVYLSNDYGNSPAATAAMTKDTIAPTINVTQNPEANSAGWDNQPVALQLDANDAGTGVEGLTYSATGAQPISETTISSGYASFTISAEAETDLSYMACDKAGNCSTRQSKTVRIDTEPPVISISQPRNHVLFTIFGQKLTGIATDSLSGADTPTVMFTSVPRGKTTDLMARCVTGCETTETGWQVDASALPSGAYRVTAIATDLAGNTGASSEAKIINISRPWLWIVKLKHQPSGRWTIFG